MPNRFNVSGWRRQQPDHRDWHFRPSRRLLATLGPTQDVTAGMGPQLDQQNLGACGPSTADECILFDQKAENLPVASASRLFIYYATRSLMGTVGQDSGVDNRTMLKALNQYGFCAESLWPYVTSQFTQRPPQACWDAALANRIQNYAAVAQTADQMRGTLASGLPFIFGFSVYQQMLSDQAAQTGIVSVPAASDTPVGGHDVTVCGYTTVDLPGIQPGKTWPAGTFRFRNHWTLDGATPWGDGGYGYIPAQGYALDPNQAGDFWVLNALPGGNPTPPPPPPPGPSPAPAPGPAPQGLQALIDSLFAQLEAQVALHPLVASLVLPMLRELQAAIDTLLSGGLAPGAFGGPLHALTPDQIRQFADMVLGLLTTVFAANPTVAGILAALKAAIDTFLALPGA